MSGYAWITLATNDPYCLGALVLAHSLKRVGTKHDLAVLVTPGVTSAMREKLMAIFSVVQEVNVLDSQDAANLALLERPELGVTFTKLHCWKLTQYEKCIFVDADALVVRNCDELFEREELSAAPDVGWPDCFNSGVFVFKPSEETFASLIAFAASKGSFDGGDQGLLNQYFNDWAYKDISKHLPFIYNMCSTATYSYLPAYKQYGEDVKIIHFIGSTKPWLQYFDTQTGQVHPSSDSSHLQSLLQHWWNIFCETVHPQLSHKMTRSTLATVWHNSYPRISTTAFTFDNNVYHNTTDFTYENIDKPVLDFSEFYDPWDNYIQIQDKSNKNNDIDRQNYRDQTDSINNEGNEFYSNSDTTSGIHDIIDLINEKHDDYSNCTDDKSNDNQEHREHFETVYNILVAEENVKLTESQDELNYLDECLLNLQYHSDPSHQLDKNDHHDYTTQPHYHHDSTTQSDTHHIQSKSYQNNDNDNENLKDDENDFNSQHDIAYTDIHTINSQTHFQTCTDSESISCQSKTNSFSELAHVNTGIAGALAKINLGMARSLEQAAYEEHVRKQSWEQGKIDYMGRDSFDNIWTKICSTISTVIEREPTPPQEQITINDNQSNTSVTVSANTKIQSAETEEAVSTLQQQHDVRTGTMRPNKLINEETIELKAPCCESQALEAKRSNQSLPMESPSATIPTPQTSLEMVQTDPQTFLAFNSSIPKLSIEGSSETYEKMKIDSLTAMPQSQECSKFIGQPTVTSSPLSPEIALDSNILAEFEKSPLIGESQTMKNITNSAVPIQVAESVLEADIKESVSEDMKPVTGEAISSISAPIQESISTVVETPLEPPAPAHSQSVEALPPAQPNGNAILDFTTNGTNENLGLEVPVLSSLATLPVLQESLAVREAICASTSSSSKPKLKELVKTQFQETKEIKAEVEGTSKCNTASDYTQMVKQSTPFGKSTVQSTRDTAQISNSTRTTAAPTSKTIENVESTTNVPDKVLPSVEDGVIKTEEELQREQPISTTQLNTPGTPIVTEATPPTSPSLDVTANLDERNKTPKKIVKKLIKKPSSDGKTEDNDTEESKKSKKIIKRGPSCVIKKSKECKETQVETTAESSASDKPKKVVKVKKATKPMLNLEASTSVPDTTSPATSQTPIPPKRKVKSVTTKSSTKKPDSEP